MGRVYAEIQQNGRRLWTLFDTGSKNTYITAPAAEGMDQRHAAVPLRVGLGGRIRTAERMCELAAKIEGKPIEVEAYITDDLGRDESGRPIEVLFGALAMQKWHILLNPAEERLDISHYPEEFTEFGITS
ncbi:retropepsin-like domain-containing protein [bacterium]|nr:retropepsin-like domain-containing protein [bacterium]